MFLVLHNKLLGWKYITLTLAIGMNLLNFISVSHSLFFENSV